MTNSDLSPPRPTSPAGSDHSRTTQSDVEEWHDAADDVPTGPDADATMMSSRPPSPLNPVEAERRLKEALDDANALKSRGNDLFRESAWQQALEIYTEGLHALPPRSPPPRSSRKGKEKQTDEESTLDEEETEETSETSPTPTPVLAPVPSAEMSPLQLMENQCVVLRSIFNSNIAACHVKLGDHEAAVRSCDESLLDVPSYAKALQRRATSNEAIGTWASLTSAQSDYKLLVETLPPNSPLLASSRRALASLPPRIEIAQKKETDEMMDKLKGLGNSLLGRFGMSTDNFKFTPNGQGGYSMNFVQ